eukprot:5035654-Prorocentrum_lima.AAC.1
MEQLGNVPAFVCGDFNLESEESSVLRRWETRGPFSDVAVRQAIAVGCAPAATTNRGRRIDHVWASQAAMFLVQGFSVLPNEFSTHHSLELRLAVTAFYRKGWVR